MSCLGIILSVSRKDLVRNEAMYDKTWTVPVLNQLQREARYRFHQTKIFYTFLTLFDWGAGFLRQFEIYAQTRLEITATYLNNHIMNFQEIRDKSWSVGNGSALRAVKPARSDSLVKAYGALRGVGLISNYALYHPTQGRPRPGLGRTVLFHGYAA